MLKPNLFVVGAAKAGTTSLYSYLDRHLDVFMSPIKEPHYFSKDIRCNDFTQEGCMNACFDIKEYLAYENLEKKHIAFIEDIKDYMQLFRDVKSEKVVGEASTGYLYSNLAAKEIYHFNQDAKIVIVLRNPVERAYSHWKMNLAAGIEDLNTPFLDAIRNDYKLLNKGYYKSHLYVELGEYCEQVKCYTNLFPQKNIKILLFDDLTKHSNKFMNEVCEFLNLSPLQHYAGEKENVTSMIKFSWLKRFNSNRKISKFFPKKWNVLLKKHLSTTNFPKLNKEDQVFVYETYFKNDIENLEKLLQVDLPSWKYKK